MRTPNHLHATVRKEKITDYLLSETHRDGRHKAAFFKAFGFDDPNWQTLAEALLDHVRKHDVTAMEVTQFGTSYVVEGIMEMPDGRSALLRTVWFIDVDAELPRFVTAYPT